jgi:hypothetical protein
MVHCVVVATQRVWRRDRAHSGGAAARWTGRGVLLVDLSLLRVGEGWICSFQVEVRCCVTETNIFLRVLSVIRAVTTTSSFAGVPNAHLQTTGESPGPVQL